MRAKPLYGDPCNRCGLCCQLSQCAVADVILGPREGGCPALRPDGLGGFFCGLANAPTLTQEGRDALTVAIGAGVGCDMPATAEDFAARETRKGEMARAAQAANRNLHPIGRRILAKLRLGPPE